MDLPPSSAGWEVVNKLLICQGFVPGLLRNVVSKDQLGGFKNLVPEHTGIIRENKLILRAGVRKLCKIYECEFELMIKLNSRFAQSRRHPTKVDFGGGVVCGILYYKEFMRSLSPSANVNNKLCHDVSPFLLI